MNVKLNLACFAKINEANMSFCVVYKKTKQTRVKTTN